MNKTNQNMPPVQDISFQIHYRNRDTPADNLRNSRPRLDDIMAQYKKINRMNRQRRLKEKEARRLSVPERTLKIFEKKGISMSGSSSLNSPAIPKNFNNPSKSFRLI